MRQVQQTGLCPCCDRFIGPARTCPYCDETAAENRTVHALRVVALILALAGLFCLYLAAVSSELPAVAIGDINPMMNFARIRLRGRVTRQPYVARENGEVDYVSFLLDDDSGHLRVAARGDVARVLMGRRPCLRAGVRIDVTGNLRFSGPGRPRLYLQSADHLALEENQP